MYKTIFLKENEKDIFGSLQEQGINTRVFEYKLANLFNRVYNNYVGYYIFKEDETIYKLIILPKTIKKSKTSEKDFVNYLLHYHRVNSIYKFDIGKKMPDSLLSLAFENNNKDEKSHLPLDEFEFFKHKAILLEIEAFFKKHKNYKRVHVDYLSQSIKYRLNLQKNVKEVDKTKIHQIQTKDIVFSIMATITFNALKLFMQYLNSTHHSELSSLVNKLKNFLLKKYSIEKGYKLTFVNLQGIKIEKTFNATNETKQLLVSIKSLFGFEQMYHDNAISVENRYDLNTTSFFIDPILFYEWYVYDILKNYADDHNKTMLFDKNTSETMTKYQIESLKNSISKSSKPDYIIFDKDKNVKTVIDAKWKNIVSLGEISSNDYLKLQFDSSLLAKKDYVTASYLVYPNLYSNSGFLNVKVENESIFDFNVLEINMNFEKAKNSLDFEYDDKVLADKIAEIEKNEALKSISKQESHDVNIERTNMIAKLLFQEELKNKDDVLNELDNHFIDSLNRLSNQIKEPTILPEIQNILDLYSDILEEESIKFLKSSSNIYSYYSAKNYRHFDYSMPGSGLWKLVELELNTSFVWYIRIKSHICSNSCPWTPIGNKKISIFHEIDHRKKVKLNQLNRNDKNKLQGIMLGGIKLLMNDKDIIEEFNNFFIANLECKTFLIDKLPTIVLDIINLRNEHAHIRAMSLDKFEELYHMLFIKSDNELNIIEDLLRFKRNIWNKKTM